MAFGEKPFKDEADKSTKPLYVRLEPGLKMRIKIQCKRLGLTEAGLTKMALTKFIEEEEQIASNTAFRRTK